MKLRLLVASTLTLGGLTLLPSTPATAAGARCEELLPEPTVAQELFTDAGRERGDLTADEEQALDVAAPVLGDARTLGAEAVSDDTLVLDTCGVPFVAEEAPEDTSAPAPAMEAAAADATGDAFALHSRPGARKTIYLDLDGAVTTGTAWNAGYDASTITSPAYSQDSDPAFSAQELADVRTIWQVVAEDFAAFDVDVTTERPTAARLNRASSTDQEYGFQAVVTRTNEIKPQCGCGGIAYLDVPRATGATYDHYSPAFVFMQGAAYDTAQAASHEIGHNLGLDHDGTVASGSTPARAYYPGHGLWGPLMGTGYRRPVSQWSKGQYAGADNPEDDLALIGRYLPALADREGGTPATASALSGRVEASLSPGGDVDHFRFTASGRTVVDLTVPAYGNVDAKATLTTASGELVEVADPAVVAGRSVGTVASGMGLRIDRTLAAGDYLLRVEGAAPTASPGPYTSYGSVGPYAVALTTQGAVEPLTVTALDVPRLTQGVAVAASVLSVRGGTAPYAATTTGLPAGLTLGADAVLRGTPSAAGTSRASVTVTDAAGAARTLALDLVVAASPTVASRPTSVTPLGVTSPGSVRTTTARTVSVPLRASGGDSRYAWSASALPSGLRLVGDRLVGRVTRAGSYRVAVTVRSAGLTSTRTVPVVVAAVPPRYLTRSTLTRGAVKARYASRVRITSPYPASWRRVAGRLPSGVRLVVASDRRSAVLTGRPRRAGTYRVALQVRTRDGAAVRTFVVRVARR
jgi:hypothetical protein